MRIIENKTFVQFNDRDSAALFSDMEFRRCRFENCKISITRIPKRRSTIRNVNLVDCTVNAGSIGVAAVENVVVDGLKTLGLFQVFGAVFNRAVLRGKIDRLMISNDVLPNLAINAENRAEEIEDFRGANSEYYRQVDWALDISRGEFKELDIRGVPTQLIRRDPETQMIITRERAQQVDWKNLKLRETLWRTWIHYFLESDETSTVLAAPKRHAKFRNYLEDLRVLQKAGVAE
jgi:hypothetical protein